MLFFILLYLRIYPAMAVASFLFGVARNRIYDWLHTYQPVLDAVLGKSPDLPKRQIRSMDEFLQAFPKLIFIFAWIFTPHARISLRT